jgi:hypothetical protein
MKVIVNHHSSDPLQAQAYRQMRRLKAFYMHLARYALVICLLAVINLFFTPSYPWVLWVAGGWGIGLLFHAMASFGFPRFLDAEWERRQVQRYLGRQRKRP